MATLNIGILVGPVGRGSNMVAIIRACQSGEIEGRVAVVVAPKEDIEAVRKARELGVECRICNPASESYGDDLLNALRDCNLVALAGYTRLLPDQVLKAFPGRVLNIHPALLPKFGGKGMYGRRVHEAVIESGEAESGCSVHLVTERYDEGHVLLQRRCAVLPDDTPESLAMRVLDEEHLAYVEAIQLFH